MQKRRDLFQYIRTRKYNIACLQDVHIDRDMLSYIKSEWGYNLVLSAKEGTTASRGILILINNNFSCDIGRTLVDPNGNFIIMELKMSDKTLTLASIYGPNDDKPQFYKALRKNINDFNNDNVVICGDWNLVLDPDMDTENYRHINNPNARLEVLKFIDEDQFIDIFRFINDDKGFTWRRLNPEKKQARLDYFLVSEENFQYCYDCKVVPGYRTDHSGIILKLKLNQNAKGRSYWKFNNSLLKDTVYIELVKKTIGQVLNTYKTRENLQNKNNEHKETKYTINDQLLFEMILVAIRGETIKYSSRKKKESIKQEIQLEEDIKKIEHDISENLGNTKPEKILSLNGKKDQLQEIRKHKLEGVMLRSRCRYEDLGEKPTSYFLNLEKRNFTNKVITKIIEEDKEYTSTEEILNSQKMYFKTLYSENIDIDDDPIETIIGENQTKLSDQDANSLEGEIKYSELAEALKNMKNSKTPGNDGFTAEFFKFFWIDLNQFILNSLNYGYKTGSLSITQKQGIITCLPKPNKSPFYLKNWRPISLLNVIYKLASSVIASRLKNVLHKLIHEDQKGFIAGRFIGENIRLIYDILFETKQQEIPGLLLSIDFQQAFDSVSWKFITKTLDYFNFGPSFKKWINIFQNGSESCILQNGHMSDYFCLQRGCRQGDPISPYIFILCAEVLSHVIRKDTNINGIVINKNEFKLSQYADDTQVFLDGTEISLRKTLQTLQSFYQMSGLKINVDKTKAIWIGSMTKSNLKLCKEYELDWNQGPIKILGVTFTPEVFNIWDHNSAELIRKVENTLKNWAKRKITLLGKITVIKSIAISKFVHLFLALPNPPDNLVKSLNKLFFNFIWNWGPDRIKRKFIVKDISKGGLRMIQIENFIAALKITWLRRQILQSNCSWNTLSNIDLENVYTKGDNYANIKAEEIKNPFWKDLLKSWGIFCKSVTIQTTEDILYSPLWYNSNFQHGQNIYFKSWYNKGIRNVIDLLDTDGNFYQFHQLQEQFNIQGTFLDYASLLRKVPAQWKQTIYQNNVLCQALKPNVSRNCYINYLLRDKKGSRTFYDILIENNIPTPPPQKWINALGGIEQDEWNTYNKQITAIKEIKLKEFQFKINNHILVTKSFLYKINKADDNMCSFCNQHPETILHLFYFCETVKTFWADLKNWLEKQANITLQLTIKSILFSKQAHNVLVNYLSLLAKYHIYRTKFFTNQISMENFLIYVRRKLQNEKYIAKLHNKQDTFIAKWSALLHTLEGL